MPSACFICPFINFKLPQIHFKKSGESLKHFGLVTLIWQVENSTIGLFKAFL